MDGNNISDDVKNQTQIEKGRCFMRNIMSRICIVYFLASLIVFGADAQINPVYQKMLQNGWKYPFENGFRKLTPPEIDTEFLASMGYNDTTVANLKKLGVDLIERWKKSTVWDEKNRTALSDCIIIGTVSRIEHPFGEKFWFHTLAYIQVEEFLRNDYHLQKEQIPVLIASGPTGAGETMMQMGEDTLSVGEHVLLFLSASSLITFAANNNMRDLYDYLINDSVVKFKIGAKYDIRDGKISNKARERNLPEVRDEIRTVVTALHRIPTTDK